MDKEIIKLVLHFPEHPYIENVFVKKTKYHIIFNVPDVNQYIEINPPKTKKIKEINPPKTKKIKYDKKLMQQKYLSIKENRDRMNMKRREKMSKDLNVRILNVLRNKMWYTLNKRSIKKQNKTINLLGCSIKELIIYLESRFLPGMDWNNYGRKTDNWCIDHIIPCAYFDLTDPEQQKECFHYTNLQPLWFIDNIKKNSFYNGEKQYHKNVHFRSLMDNVHLK
jgi:hypothetical protein